MPSDVAATKPRIAVSADYFDFIAVCPEVVIGLGIPCGLRNAI